MVDTRRKNIGFVPRPISLPCVILYMYPTRFAYQLPRLYDSQECCVHSGATTLKPMTPSNLLYVLRKKLCVCSTGKYTKNSQTNSIYLFLPRSSNIIMLYTKTWAIAVLCDFLQWLFRNKCTGPIKIIIIITAKRHSTQYIGNIVCYKITLRYNTPP